MHEVHKDPFEVPDRVSELGRMHNCFQLQFADEINGQLYFSIRNVKGRSFVMDNIFYLCSHQFVKIGASVSGITIGPNELLQFSVPRELFSTHNEIRSVLLVFQNGVEYVEHFHLKVALDLNMTLDRCRSLIFSLFFRRSL